MLSNDYELNFGVELELAFVFHENLLLEQLRRDRNEFGLAFQPVGSEDRENPWIQKTLTQQQRRELRLHRPAYKGSRGKEYMGWAINTEGIDDPTFEDAPEGYSLSLRNRLIFKQTRDKKLRTYTTEPMAIAKEAMRSNVQGTQGLYWTNHPTDTNIVIDCHHDRKPVNYDNWQITNDLSLMALKPRELEAYIRKYKNCPRDCITKRDVQWREAYPNESPETVPAKLLASDGQFSVRPSNAQGVASTQGGEGRPREEDAAIPKPSAVALGKRKERTGTNEPATIPSEKRVKATDAADKNDAKKQDAPDLEKCKQARTIRRNLIQD